MWSIDPHVCYLHVYVRGLWLGCLAFGVLSTSRTYVLCVEPSMNLIPRCINHTHTTACSAEETRSNQGKEVGKNFDVKFGKSG